MSQTDANPCPLCGGTRLVRFEPATRSGVPPDADTWPVAHCPRCCLVVRVGPGDSREVFGYAHADVDQPSLLKPHS